MGFFGAGVAPACMVPAGGGLPPGPIPPAPAASLSITSLSQASGFTFGKQLVTVNGTLFTSDAVVSFNGINASYTIWISSTQLLAYTASSASAVTGNVTVTQSSGSASLVNAWTYVFWDPAVHYGCQPNLSGGTAPTVRCRPSGIVQSGGVCSAWTNEGSRAAFAPAVLAAGKPTYSSSGGPNGGPCALSNGSQAFDCGKSTTANPGTTKYFRCVLLAKASSLGVAQFMIGAQDSTYNWGMLGDTGGHSKLSVYGNSTSVIDAYTRLRVDDNAWRIHEMLWDGTSRSGGNGIVRAILDGEVQVSRRTAAATALPSSNDHIGFMGAITGGSVSGTYSATMSAAELLCYEAQTNGLLDKWGLADYFQRTYAVANSPILRSSSPGVGALSGADLSAIVDSHGNLDVAVTLTSTQATDSTTQPTSDFWAGTSTDGAMGVHYNAGTDVWSGIVRGVTVIQANNVAGPCGPFYLNADPVTCRFVYAPTSLGLENCLEFTVNGCTYIVNGSAASGSALAAPSAVTLGSSIGGGNAWGASAAKLATSSSLSNVTGECKYEGQLFGDSLTHRETALASTDRYFYQGVEATYRPGIVSIAIPNEVMGDQVSAYQSSFLEGDPCHAWRLGELGTNECWTFSDSETTIATMWNADLPLFRAATDRTKLIFQSPPPYATTGGQAAGYAVWKKILSDMGAPGYSGGTAPISGWDYLDTAMTTGLLNDGTDTEAAAYTAGEGKPHFNKAGSAVAGKYKHDAVRAVGLI
jgi:hypothetical protein